MLPRRGRLFRTQVANPETVDQNEQVGQEDKNLYFNRKGDIEQVRNNWITVGKAVAREGTKLPKPDTWCRAKLGPR